MKKRYQYILFLLIFIGLYLLYLITVKKYEDFSSDLYQDVLKTGNGKLQSSIERKQDYLAYVKTSAFIDKIAKSSQNRKNPGEEVVFLVSQDEVDEYKHIDVEKQIVGEPWKNLSDTYGMNNYQKWIYYILKTDIRG